MARFYFYQLSSILFQTCFTIKGRCKTHYIKIICEGFESIRIKTKGSFTITSAK